MHLSESRPPYRKTQVSQTCELGVRIPTSKQAHPTSSNVYRAWDGSPKILIQSKITHWRWKYSFKARALGSNNRRSPLTMKECVGPDHPTDLVTSSASREGGKKKKKKKLLQLYTFCVSDTSTARKISWQGDGSWADPKEGSHQALESKASFPHTGCLSPTFNTEHSTLQNTFLPSPHSF